MIIIMTSSSKIAVLLFRGHHIKRRVLLVLLPRGDIPPGTPTLHWKPQLRPSISQSHLFFLRVGACLSVQQHMPPANAAAVIISKLLRDAAAESLVLFSSQRR